MQIVIAINEDFQNNTCKTNEHYDNSSVFKMLTVNYEN